MTVGVLAPRCFTPNFQLPALVCARPDGWQDIRHAGHRLILVTILFCGMYNFKYINSRYTGLNLQSDVMCILLEIISLITMLNNDFFV